jgi:hypothetical protein
MDLSNSVFIAGNSGDGFAALSPAACRTAGQTENRIPARNIAAVAGKQRRRKAQIRLVNGFLTPD